MQDCTMENSFNIQRHTGTNSLLRKQERQVAFVNNILANRNLSDLLFDRNRVLKAIDLAVNARLRLDPFFDPFEINNIDKDRLADQIIASITTGTIKTSGSLLFSVDVPKNKITSRTAKYLAIEDYAVRYLIALLLSEKITFSDNVFGGKSEIFLLDDGSFHENERTRFQNIQNSVLLSETFDWIVYIDIREYYDSVKKEILIDIVKRKLSLDDEDIVVKLAGVYFPTLTIGCWCDHFLQNIYFNDLDAVLNAHSWTYLRMTDDIRVFCKSREEAELAVQIIKTELAKLKLTINGDKHFVIKPMTSLERFKENSWDFNKAELSPILELNKITDLLVENVFLLSRDSGGNRWISHKYEMEFPRKFTYIDEILSKTGFRINGADVKDIITDLEQKQKLSFDELKLLDDIIFNTYSSYRFTNRIIRLFISNAFLQPDVKEVENLLSTVFQKLSKDHSKDFYNYSKGANSYLSYIFLKLIFLQNPVKHSLLLKYEKDIWKWFFKLIINNTYRSSYISVVVRYIIEQNLFQIVHSSHGEVLKLDKFWAQIIDKEADLKKDQKHNKDYYVLNSIIFLEGMFASSDVINKKKAEYYYYKGQYIMALDFFLALQTSVGLSNNLFEIGYCYHKKDDYVNAINYYSEYLNQYQSSAAYGNRALMYQHLKQYDEALFDFTEAIIIEESVLNLENRAACYMELSQFANAILDLDRAIEVGEANNEESYTFSYAYIKRAKAKKELGNISGAISDIKFYCNLRYKPNCLKDKTAIYIKELLEDKLDY
jgi:tetratricopeptide (TPR) repeat protein